MSIGPTMNVTLQQVQQIGVDNFQFDSAQKQQAFDLAVQNAIRHSGETGGTQGGAFNPSLEIPTPSNAQQLGLTAGALDNAGGTIDDTIAQVMEMLHKLGVEMRATSKEMRASEREVQQEKLQDAADKIRQAATFALVSGITSGVMSIGSAVMSGVGAYKMGASAAEQKAIMNNPEGDWRFDMKGVNPDDAMKLKDNPKAKKLLGLQDEGTWIKDLSAKQNAQMQALNTKSQATQMKWQAFSQLAQALGQVGAAGFSYGEKEKQAEQQEAQKGATMAGYRVQDQDDIVKNMTDLVNEVRSKLSDVMQARSQVESKIWS